MNCMFHVFDSILLMKTFSHPEDTPLQCVKQSTSACIVNDHALIWKRVNCSSVECLSVEVQTLQHLSMLHGAGRREATEYYRQWGSQTIVTQVSTHGGNLMGKVLSCPEQTYSTVQTSEPMVGLCKWFTHYNAECAQQSEDVYSPS